jgi:hypothetical protein
MLERSIPLERRRQRSAWASEALHLQLLEVADAYHLEALVLSDSLGHLWAASGSEAAPMDMIAELARDGARADGGALRDRKQQGRKPVLVRRLQVGAATLFLSAKGTPKRSRPALEQAAPGVERILGALL